MSEERYDEGGDNDVAVKTSPWTTVWIAKFVGFGEYTDESIAGNMGVVGYGVERDDVFALSAVTNWPEVRYNHPSRMSLWLGVVRFCQ